MTDALPGGTRRTALSPRPKGRGKSLPTICGLVEKKGVGTSQEVHETDGALDRQKMRKTPFAGM